MFIEIYEHSRKITTDEYIIKKCDKYIIFLKKENNVKKFGLDDNGDPYISLKEDYDNIISHNIKYDSYIKYVNIIREEKLNRILI